MRKISKSRGGNNDWSLWDAEKPDDRPRCIPGATITSWRGSLEIDLSALFANPPAGATVAGAAATRPARPERSTVALSDGTEITFATSGQFMAVTSR